MAREQLQELLAGGADRETNIVSALVEIVTRLVVQELVEGEQRDFLGGRGRYDRRSEEQVGSRNGYERGRLRTAEGVRRCRGAAGPRDGRAVQIEPDGLFGRQQRGAGVAG